MCISCLHESSSPILPEFKSIGICEIPVPQNQIHSVRQTSPDVRVYETGITWNKIPLKFITYENFQLSCCSEICEILYTQNFYAYSSLVCETRKATVDTILKQLEYVTKGHIAMQTVTNGERFAGLNFQFSRVPQVFLWIYSYN